jgi:hypothetical protein
MGVIVYHEEGDTHLVSRIDEETEASSVLELGMCCDGSEFARASHLARVPCRSLPT